ncbi:GCG_CRPN prefix-to-repeats domain-containing protein [Lichenifustis flavocetrariae]|uniref:GCG_CRPN prefix-to-repeats domain-containing protein n=1 Tax=Lichenifustis flavocetrariae TaxID=2949735 RepID=UPI003D0F3FCF
MLVGLKSVGIVSQFQSLDACHCPFLESIRRCCGFLWHGTSALFDGLSRTFPETSPGCQCNPQARPATWATMEKLMSRSASIIIASLLVATTSFTSAEALPMPNLSDAAASTVFVSGGCGPYGHRGPYGGCRPGGGWRGPGWHRGWGPGWRRGPGWHRRFWNHRRY